MAPQALGSIRENSSAQTASRSAPTLGLRGGLGKTLLIAFLLLAIVPLGLLSFLTYSQIQRDTGQKLSASLESIAALKEARLLDWVESYEQILALLAATPEVQSDLSGHLAAVQAVDPTLTALILIDESNGQRVAAPASALEFASDLRSMFQAGQRLAIMPAGAAGETRDAPLVAVSYSSEGKELVALLRPESLRQIITAPDGQEEGVTTNLVTRDGLVASAEGWTLLAYDRAEAETKGILGALNGYNGSGAYTDLDGVPVFGAYRWNPELQAGLVVMQAQTEALASGNTVTAMVLGATLVVALITATIAAAVTRRLTRPIVQLTETAAWMARGDLNQKVTVTRRDEIGVLARAFNRMAAELRVLYAELEAKVAERTRQLEEAHQRTRYHVMQLSISAEVARVASSIRNVDELLKMVVKLIGDAFELHHVSIYLLDESGQRIVWQAGSNGVIPSKEELVGGPSLIGQVAADGQRRVVRQQSGPSRRGDSPQALRPCTACEMAVPFRSRRQMLGVLYLQSSRADDFDGNDEMVYQSLADQLGIAIENARAYALERETVERLRELDRIQSQFLTNMSHALRTPLNSIIGFSRIMLKELDGPLNDLQHTDLVTIHDSGRQLLGLINDMLELTQLELGTASFSLAEVDLAEVIEGVMATARALAMSKPVQLYHEVPDDLPCLYTDGQRVRQVILALLSNAVKYTDEGSIRLLAARDDGHITISVRDTGIGIPPEEQTQIFSDPQQDEASGETATPGFGLAISRRVVEHLGGQIWVESKAGVGSTFTFTLPMRPAEGALAPAGDNEGVK
jgi:signal transduction histidine kinase